jgi:hypothetical protein
MRKLFVFGLVLATLSGCAMSPPKPPEPQGDYRPVNSNQYLIKRIDGNPVSAASEFDN